MRVKHPTNLKDLDLQQKLTTPDAVSLNEDGNEDEFGFGGAE